MCAPKLTDDSSHEGAFISTKENYSDRTLSIFESKYPNHPDVWFGARQPLAALAFSNIAEQF
jgi:hypothetical protein